VGVSNTVIIGAGVSLIGIAPLLTQHLLSIKEKPPHSEGLAAAD
jgi:hypothetical protein